MSLLGGAIVGPSAKTGSGAVVDLGVGEALGVALGVGFGVSNTFGEVLGVGIAVGIGFGVFTFTPLFQINFFPDLMQVNLMLSTVLIWFNLGQGAPAFAILDTTTLGAADAISIDKVVAKRETRTEITLEKEPVLTKNLVVIEFGA